MTLFKFFARKIELAAKRRRLRHINNFIADLEDQVASGEACLYRYRELARQIENRVNLLEDPADVVRRLGAGV